MPIGGHHSTAGGNDTWITPKAILDALGDFDLDPCAAPSMPWPAAARSLTVADNGLTSAWEGRVWLNPPYGPLIGRWLGRMADHDHGTALIFARTETAAFFRHIWERGSALLFLRGRLNFHRQDGTRAVRNAGAPSVLIAYGIDDADILADCAIDGAFVPLSCRGQTVVVFRHIPAMTWGDVLTEIVRRQGGQITVQAAYALVKGHPKARRNPNWQAKVRQVLQERCDRIGPGQYRLPV